MSKNEFSVAVIVRNEEKTLPKLLSSLKNIDDIVILDTGSTDETVKIAKKAGCNVTEVGDRYLHTIDKSLALKINQRFVVGVEKPIVKAGDKYFDFASARNHAASLAKNNMVSFADADEQFSVLDTDKIKQLIKDGNEQFEYNFVFAHDVHGREAVKFIQSKFYDRRKMEWVGIVHEVLSPIGGGAKRLFVGEDIFKLEHFQNNETNRHSYLIGLAVDCYENPDKDRNSHYLARELLWAGRLNSSIQEFQRHIEMDKWPAEKAQSMIFIGDCYGALNQPDRQAEWYSKSIFIDNSRREAFIKLAHFYKHNNNPQAAACYASAATQIPWSGFYATNMADYQNVPHEILYWAKGWLGHTDEAKEHLTKALDYSPFDPNYLRDTQFYFDYADQGIDGWMQFSELTWLYEMAKKMDSILEVGSWKGRSTHALLSGCRGKVTAVDTFGGSQDPKDWTHDLAKQSDIYSQFMKNVGHFDNLEVMKMSSVEAAKKLEGKKFDMVFIDAGHTKEEVAEDIEVWKDKARIIMSGHDYIDTIWMGVKEAVDEGMGAIKRGGYSIWYKEVQTPFVSIVIPTLGRPDKLNNLLKLIKENAGYDNYEVIVKYDQFPPNNTGVPKLVKQAVDESRGDLVMFLGNDCVPGKDFLQLAVFRMIKEFPELDGLVGLNDGYWKGEFCTHFLASKKLL